MDLLHAQLAALQRRLSFVATTPIDWKRYVQVSSWAVTLFESYLLYVFPFFFYRAPFSTAIKAPSVSPLFENGAPCGARGAFRCSDVPQFPVVR